MKKLTILVIILSLIGCNKEILESETVYIDTSPPTLRELYFIGEFDGEQINSQTDVDLNTVQPEVLSGNTTSNICYKEKTILGHCSGNPAMDGVEFIFLKNFVSTDITCDDKQSMYNLGGIPFGNIDNRENGIVIRYTDDDGKIWSTDYGLQNYDASFGILSSTISKNGKLVIQLWGKAKLYNLDGNHIEINGELSLLVLSCFGLIY